MTSDIEEHEILALASTIRLDDPHFISEYGSLQDAGDSIDALSNELEQSPVARLAGKITELVARLEDADPKHLKEKRGWFARLTGAHLEVTVRYDVARQSVDELLADGEAAAQSVRTLMHSIDAMIRGQGTASRALTLAVAAGQRFLDDNPQAGLPDGDKLRFDNPRERFARKLANIATLIASNEMSVAQLRLTHAQGFDLLDRFEEMSQVLVPVWRRHLQALAASKNNPELLATANQAHESLMQSLVAMTRANRPSIH